MKANELRIGNLIQVNDWIISVGMIQDNFISWRLENQNAFNPFIHIAKFKPILITNEWLERFGFSEENDIYKGNLAIEIDKDSGDLLSFFTSENIWLIRVYGDWVEIKNKPKYVHELQNLYFALTGKELKLNLL